VGTYQARNGLDALGDPTRRAIFERLAEGPRPVGELAQGLLVSRPAVSQHLKVLKERAFSVFTDQIGSWWPPEHHIIQVPLDKMVVELRAGGRCDGAAVRVPRAPRHGGRQLLGRACRVRAVCDCPGSFWERRRGAGLR
jgi:DNA-binding transcriptional ArsR family regulator